MNVIIRDGETGRVLLRTTAHSTASALEAYVKDRNPVFEPSPLGIFNPALQDNDMPCSVDVRGPIYGELLFSAWAETEDHPLYPNRDDNFERIAQP